MADHSFTPRLLPDEPNLEWLRKEARRQLRDLQATNPDAQLADAQFDARSGTAFQAGGR